MNKLTVFVGNIIEFSFYLLLLFTPLVFTTVNFELFEFNKIVVVYFLTIVIATAWLIRGLLVGKIEIRRSVLDIPILLFLLSQIISTAVSIDRHVSLFGYYSRFNGGLLSTICYIILFYVAQSSFNRQKIITILNVIIFGGLIVSLWGIPSHFNLDPSCKLITGAWTSSCWSIDFQPTLRIFSTIGQPNWLAAYLSLLLPITIAFIFFAKKWFVKSYYLFASMTLFWAFILTNSRSASLGLAIALVLMTLTSLVLALKSKSVLVKLYENRNWLFTALIVLLFSAIFLLFGGSLIGRVKLAKSAISGQSTAAPSGQTALLSGGTESGKIRFIVWQGAIDIFRHFPIFGSGVETFGYTYYSFRPASHNQTTEWNFLYNKAHNEYLNYLANTGLAGLASYLMMIALVFYLVTKQLLSKQDFYLKLLTVGLAAGYLSNLIQNFFGFSVVVTSLLAFLYPAAIINLYQDKPKYLTLNLPKIIKTTPIRSLFLAMILTAGLFLASQVKNYWLADAAFANGQNAEAASYLDEALQKYQTAADLSPTLEPFYYSNLGAVAADLALDQNDKTRQLEYVQKAKSAIDLTLDASPANLNYWRSATQTYLKLGLIDQTYIDYALKSAETAAQIAPTEPEVRYQLALVQRAAGYPASASATLKKAIDLKPDYIRARDELERLEKK